MIKNKKNDKTKTDNYIDSKFKLNDDDDILNDDAEIEDDDVAENPEELDYIEEDITEIEGNDFDLIYRLNTNKHRQEGKHSLKRDTIFKGKLDEEKKDNKTGHLCSDLDSAPIENFKLLDVEYDIDDRTNQNELTKDVYEILDKRTDLDFKQNRRKPNKDTFNSYYELLLNNLGFRYTRSEIFVELSYYFTDNIFNMFKILDKDSANIIIKELIQKGYLKNIKGIEFL